MKPLSAALLAHLQQPVTSLASCWLVTRTDGLRQGFTDHDRDLLVDGQIYLAREGYDRAALKSTAGTDTDETELSGLLDADCIDEADLLAGLYDHAAVKLFLVNWQDLSMGILPLSSGWLGEVHWTNGRFTAELRGLSNALQREIGNLYTPECDADLGDTRCGVDLDALVRGDVIAAVTDRRRVRLQDYDGADGSLDGGLLHVMSGANGGRRAEIERQVGREITTFLPLPLEMAAGDAVAVYPGCDKRFATCRDRFANGVNFRGFPHIPGTDALPERSDDF